MKNFIEINDFSKEEILKCIDDAIKFKNKNSHPNSIASGKILAMIFEKKSTRTRLSFDVAIKQLGGSSIILDISDIHLGAGNENLTDTSKTIALYADALVLRVNNHTNIVEMAKNSPIPIINGLSNLSHPCQVMADMMTIIEEKKSLNNLNIIWMGPITNVAHSWIEAYNKKLGFSLTILCPESLKRKYEERCKLYNIEINNDIFSLDVAKDILGKADVILTDTWESMGEKVEKQELQELQNFRVSQSIMDTTPSECLFMHCLPANRNQEVEAQVIDGPSSRVWQEAENRLHIQKQILIECFD